MTNHFNIHWTDLTPDKREEIEELVRERILDDEELIAGFREEAEDDERRDKEEYEEFCRKPLGNRLAKPYKPIPIEQRVEDYVEEAVDDEIRENFRAKGEA